MLLLSISHAYQNITIQVIYTQTAWTRICTVSFLHMHACVYLHLQKLQLHYSSKNPFRFTHYITTEKNHKKLCTSTKVNNATGEDTVSIKTLLQLPENSSNRKALFENTDLNKIY